MDNKTGNLGSKVSVSREGYKVVVSTKDESTDKKVVSKRYIKYCASSRATSNRLFWDCSGATWTTRARDMSADPSLPPPPPSPAPPFACTVTKKYLKKNEIRDYIKVNSSSKGVYELRYFKTAEDAE